MSLVKMRERGQLTIPYEYRKDLGLEEREMINVIKAGEVLILTRKQPAGDSVSKKIENAMKKKGLSLQDLLSDLKDQRRRYNKEEYGKAKA